LKRNIAFILLLTQMYFLMGMGRVPLVSDQKCALCGREVHHDMFANLTFKNGESEPACCLQCAITYEKQTGKKAEYITVTDYYSHETVDSQKAFFVIRSNISPCCNKEILRIPNGNALMLKYDRCLPSIIAFENKDNATKFMTEHGGTLETIQDIRSSD